MKRHHNTTKFRSNMEAINLHIALNNELERFHKCVNAIRNNVEEHVSHLETERLNIVSSIRTINNRIKSLATMQKIS